MFFLVQNYRDAGAAFVPVFVASLWCGSVVLAWLWLRSGRSTLLAILWHGSYDLLAGSAASAGAAGLAVNVLIDTAGVCLALAELRLPRRGGRCSPRWTSRQPAVRSGSQAAIERAADPRASGGLLLLRLILEKSC
jgi:hypothetical protein